MHPGNPTPSKSPGQSGSREVRASPGTLQRPPVHRTVIWGSLASTLTT